MKAIYEQLEHEEKEGKEDEEEEIQISQGGNTAFRSFNKMENKVM